MNDTKGMKEMNTMISDFNKMVVFFVPVLIRWSCPSWFIFKIYEKKWTRCL